jgi:phenylacetate-CoA ligase
MVRRDLSPIARFVELDLDAELARRARTDPSAWRLELARETARTVPAYRRFLDEHGIGEITSWDALPVATKESYVKRYPLEDRCRGGRLESCDMLAVSSGSTGEPTIWPRFVTDELAIAERFEQIFRGFGAHEKRTLAVVCFPLGTWVGGMFTTDCVRHLAAKGYPIVTVTPGNVKPEIARVVAELAPRFEQVVLLGYPPFIKDVIDHGVGWERMNLKLVLAGEVFSEDWRTLVAARAGIEDPARGFASMYGTADGGVLACETPASIAARRWLAAHPAEAKALFGDDRLPTLAQFDPFVRSIEATGGSLVVSGPAGVPLVRYGILDRGGVISWDELQARTVKLDGCPLPFVWVFGRGAFAVSIYGANVFPETVSMGLEQPTVAPWVTGKFVLEVKEDERRDVALWIAVELAAGVGADDAKRDAIARSIRQILVEKSSEYAAYVPPAKQEPRVTLWPEGDPSYFPVGVKHRYSR